MDPERSVKSWLQQVEEDYLTAKALLAAGRYTWCAFVCQQFLEKNLKALYVKRFEKVPPYTHSLPRLIKELNLNLPAKLLSAVQVIDKYYIAARYPSYKRAVNVNSRREAENIFRRAEEVRKWLEKELAV